MFFFNRKEKALQAEVDRLTQLAYFDSLTGLPNRISFYKKMEELSAKCDTNNLHEPVAIFLVDLDNFKPINDTHGHAIGDTVLAKISNQLELITQSRTGYESIVARLGGDEFVFMFECMDEDESRLIAERIINSIKQPMIVNNVEIRLSASVGIALYPRDGLDTSSVLKAADLAMYSAKDFGKDQFVFHDPSMHTKIQRRVAAEALVREIVFNTGIDLNYQPIIDVKTEKIVGCEALIRRQNTVYSPQEIIDAAEQSNLIIPLGMIIFRAACEFGVQCLAINKSMYMAINVSPPQIADSNFKTTVEAILKETGFPATQIILEVTETVLIRNFQTSSKILTELQDMGIRICIDDFGKGYSSFNYLHNLPISKLKIDMSFVQQLGKDKKSNEIVKSIILMAKALGLITCAEGVETQTQFDILKQYECTQVQGFFKYPALTPADFLDVLIRNS